MAHNYDVGTRAWQPDSTEGWVASEVMSKDIQEDRVKLLFRLENDEVCLKASDPFEISSSTGLLVVT